MRAHMICLERETKENECSYEALLLMLCEKRVCIYIYIYLYKCI